MKFHNYSGVLILKIRLKRSKCSKMIQKRQNEDLFTVNGDEINLELDILTLFINTYCVWNLDGRNTLNENSFHLQYLKEEAVNVYDEEEDEPTTARRQTSSSQMESSVEERLKSNFFVTRFEAWIEKNEIPWEFADCSIEGLSRLNIGVNITMVTNVLGIRKRLKSKIHDTEFLEIACQTKGKSKKRRNYATRLKRYLHRYSNIVQVFLDILFINVIPLGFFYLLESTLDWARLSGRENVLTTNVLFNANFGELSINAEL